MKVIRCSEKDIDSIYEIEQKSFNDPLMRETMLADLKKEDYYCYALWEDCPLAFVSFEKVVDEGQIISVAVHPDYRQKGYGTKLFYEVCSMAKKDGIEFFTLEVRCDNIPAIALYEKLGFKSVGVRKNYYQNPDCDGILMDLHLRED